MLMLGKFLNLIRCFKQLSFLVMMIEQVIIDSSYFFLLFFVCSLFCTKASKNMTQSLFCATTFPSFSLFLGLFDGFNVVANVQMCGISSLLKKQKREEKEKKQKQKKPTKKMRGKKKENQKNLPQYTTYKRTRTSALMECSARTIWRCDADMYGLCRVCKLNAMNKMSTTLASMKPGFVRKISAQNAMPTFLARITSIQYVFPGL